MAAGEPCHNCNKDCEWWTSKRKLRAAILCYIGAAILALIRYG